MLHHLAHLLLFDIGFGGWERGTRRGKRKGRRGRRRWGEKGEEEEILVRIRRTDSDSHC